MSALACLQFDVCREHKLKAWTRRADFTAAGGVNANKTAIYADILASQRRMVWIYQLLTMWMAVSLPMVRQQRHVDGDHTPDDRQERFWRNRDVLQLVG